jgi:hypothetical protein
MRTLVGRNPVGLLAASAAVSAAALQGPKKDAGARILFGVSSQHQRCPPQVTLSTATRPCTPMSPTPTPISSVDRDEEMIEPCGASLVGRAFVVEKQQNGAKRDDLHSPSSCFFCPLETQSCPPALRPSIEELILRRGRAILIENHRSFRRSQ